MSSVIATYLTIAAMLALTTFPVLVPAIITTGHAIRRRISAPGPRRLPAHGVPPSRRRNRLTSAGKTRWTTLVYRVFCCRTAAPYQ